MSQGEQSDKILYMFKTDTELKTNKIHMLGLQGATSGTNTRTLQTTATKTVQIKGLGSANQQRVVDVIFTQDAVPGIGDRLFKVLKDAWKNQEIIHLWRCDFNHMSGTSGSRTVEAEYAQCLLANFPVTEGLAAIMSSNLTFEVNGIAIDEDSTGKAETLAETVCDAGTFDAGSDEALYSWSDGTDVGTTGSGS